MRRLLPAVLFLLSFSASAEIEWLHSHLTQLASESHLVKSYSHKKQSYLYDQALTLISLSHAKNFSKARGLALALKKLQLPNGSWYFSYYLDGSSPHPREGDMQPNGAIAWAALALMTYEFQSKDKSFRPEWEKALHHLERNFVKVDGFKGMGLRFSQVDNSQTSWKETDVVALEHVLDSLSAFRAAYKLTKRKSFQTHQLALEKFALEFWDEGQGHFWSGVTISNSKINRSEFYLDNQTWSALALEHLGLQKMMKQALSSSCSLMVKDKTWVGFKEAKRSIASADFIWSEGTAGKAMALERYQTKCEGTKSESYLSTLESMKVDGGVLYVNKTVPQFEAQPSVAGTAWTWLLKNKINPFIL
ncbi:MAG: hypothetical protein LW878_06590 [Proteobacteria bacterium]|nr:hypothetical protein [Pseudomonadota bacterium]